LDRNQHWREPRGAAVRGQMRIGTYPGDTCHFGRSPIWMDPQEPASERGTFRWQTPHAPSADAFAAETCSGSAALRYNLGADEVNILSYGRQGKPVATSEYKCAGLPEAGNRSGEASPSSIASSESEPSAQTTHVRGQLAVWKREALCAQGCFPNVGPSKPHAVTMDVPN
jgi:hypothetical protein